MKAKQYFLIVISIISFDLSNEINFNYLHDNSITLKINKKGNDIYVYYKECCNVCSQMFDEIYINDKKENQIKNKYDFNEENNIIKLIWTKKIENIECMFNGCSDITEVDFSDFDTSSLGTFAAMFQSCSSLKFVNFASLDTKSATYMGYMFFGCSSLRYINFGNAKKKEISYDKIFKNVNDNLIICGKNIDWNSIFPSEWSSIDINCGSNSNEYKCYKKNTNTEYNKYLCKNTCGNNFYQIQNTNTYNCQEIPISYYMDENDESSYPQPKPCYSSCKYCNINGNDDEHNCLECKDNFKYIIVKNDFINCHQKCSLYYYTDINTKNMYCIQGTNCPSDYNKLIENKGECIAKCSQDKQYKYEFQNKCYISCPKDSIGRDNIEDFGKTLYGKYFCKPICSEETPFEMIKSQECLEYCDIKFIQDGTCILNFEINNQEKTEEENEEDAKKKGEIKLYDIMIKNIEKKFTSDKNIITNLDKNKKEIITYNKMTITLSTYDIQKNMETSMTNINLGKCGDLLLKSNNNKKLYIEKIEVNIEGYDIPIIGFNVYTKNNDNNLIQLSLSVCKKEKYELYIPVNVPDNLDKINLSSGYFNDICYPATSDKGTDIIRKDRIKDFVENNKTRCQNDCAFSKYIEEYKKVECTCDIKEVFSSFGDYNINKTKFYEKYINIRNIANINILICYKVLFSKIGLKNNYVSYFISAIIILHFICMILYYGKCWFNHILKIIKNISNEIKNMSLIVKRRSLKKVTVIPFKNKRNTININKRNNNNIPLLNKVNRYSLNNKKISYIKKNNFRLKSNIKNNNIPRRINNSSVKTLNINKISKPKFIANRAKNIMLYNYGELNNLPYNIALQRDKRTYCQYYFSLLLTKHFLLFTFCNNKDYNIKLIKITLFFFCFSLYLVINTLFFSDSTMHKIYEDNGTFDLIYQIPQILYSALISSVINILIKFLALSEGAIIEYKALKNKIKNKKVYNKGNNHINLVNKEKDLTQRLKIKFCLYFFLSTLLLLCFWYYISMFCVIYKNTQFHLIKDSLISYGISLLYPFGAYLLPGIFRIPALSNNKNNRKCTYRLSVLLQSIV